MKSFRISLAAVITAGLAIAGVVACVSCRHANDDSDPQGPVYSATHPKNVKPITLMLHWQQQAQFAGYMMAVEKGFFAQVGLANVELEFYRGGDWPFAKLADGRVDFCTGWLSQAIERRAGGADIVNIAQVMNRSAMMLVAKKNSGISAPADISGKKVGLWGGDFNIAPTAFFAKYDLTPKIIPQTASIVPFLRGGVDVVSAMYYNEYHKLMEAGLKPDDMQIFLFSDLGVDFPEDGIYCTSQTRRDRERICAAMVAGVIKGWRYALANEEETIRVVMRYCNENHVGTNRAHQRWMLRAMGKFIDFNGPTPAALNKTSYENVCNILKEQKIITAAPKFEEFYLPTAEDDR